MTAAYVCVIALLLVFVYVLCMIKLGKKLRTNRMLRERLGEWEKS